MLYEIRFEKAIEIFSCQLKEMKKELLELKAMRLKKRHKKSLCAWNGFINK